MRLPRPAAALLAALLALAPLAAAALDARLVQQPAVSATQIVFVYGDDLWLVPKEGGLAVRLTNSPGRTGMPRFSPDGKTVAFTANYDGNYDAYAIPAAGGVPERLTYHPAMDLVLNWAPDGKGILLASTRESPSRRFNQLYKVPAAGGLPEKLPVAYAESAALSPDGSVLAFCPNHEDLRSWKRYRGGDVSRLYLLDLKAKTSIRVGDDGASYGVPMWHGSTLYLFSDRGPDKRFNIWAYDPKSAALRQVTDFKEFDVHTPSIGPSDLVFECGGRLYRLGLPGEQLAEVKVEVVTDRADLKPRAVSVEEDATHPALSPNGLRVLFEARGDLFSVPEENGPTYRLTRTSGAAERYPAWTPDGKQVAYWSDRTGEYELALRPADGSGAERTVTKLGPGYRYSLSLSPDGKRAAFVDQAMRVNLCDLATGAVTVLDRGLWLFHEVQDDGHESLETFRASWSPDSRYVAWARELEGRTGALFIHDTKVGKTTQVTQGFYSDSDPVFSRDGKYLFFLTKRNFAPIYSQHDASWIYANMTKVAAVPLKATTPALLAPKNDPAADGKPEAEGGEKEGAAVPPVEVDLEGFEARAELLPIKAGAFRDLAAADGALLYRRVPLAAVGETLPSPLMRFDLEEMEEMAVLADAKSASLSADGSTLLVRDGEGYALVDPDPDQKVEAHLSLAGLKVDLDPAAEWAQIFRDAWRLERDFFYDPKMHGVDWAAMRARYEPLVAQCASREDLNFVLGELIGELNSSHAYRGGGDTPEAPERATGLLGCTFALEGGAYKIARIYDGAPWDAEVRSPLKAPGVSVKEGEYLLAVNGVPVDTAKDPWAALEGLAGVTVELTVGPKPALAGSRKVLVKTLESEARLINLAWIEANRRKVERASGGRVGYLYVPDTMYDGQNELYRQVMGQLKKGALVIDERFNSGGQIPDRFTELLDRPILNYWGVRDGQDWPWPPFAHQGPKVMIMNGWSGSGGDCFPFYFKEQKLGPLVGRRTWGGLIGISGAPELVDGGVVTVPTFGMYGRDGKWLIEGHGVDPDIPVEDDPALMMAGGDPQLDRAVAEALSLLERAPYAPPAKPAFPDRSR